MSTKKNRGKMDIEISDRDRKWIRIYVWIVMILGFADFFGISFKIVPFWTIFIILGTLVLAVAYIMIKYLSAGKSEPKPHNNTDSAKAD